MLAVNDVDGHMRNHGVLRGRRGWRLAPLFDVNPWPRAWPQQSTPVAPGSSRTGRQHDELVEHADAFGLTRDEAWQVVRDIGAAVRPWADVAESYGIEDPAGGVVATAFDAPR